MKPTLSLTYHELSCVADAIRFRLQGLAYDKGTIGAMSERGGLDQALKVILDTIKYRGGTACSQ